MRRISLFFHALVVGFEAQDCSPSGTRKHGILKMDTGRFSFKSPKKKIRQETKKKIEISSANSIPANSLKYSFRRKRRMGIGVFFCGNCCCAFHVLRHA